MFHYLDNIALQEEVYCYQNIKEKGKIFQPLIVGLPFRAIAKKPSCQLVFKNHQKALEYCKRLTGSHNRIRMPTSESIAYAIGAAHI